MISKNKARQTAMKKPASYGGNTVKVSREYVRVARGKGPMVAMGGSTAAGKGARRQGRSECGHEFQHFVQAAPEIDAGRDLFQMGPGQLAG